MAQTVSHHRTTWWQVACWMLSLPVLVVGSTSATSRASELRVTPIVRAIQEAAPAIVNIHGRKTLRGEAADVVTSGDREVNGMGTGVVIDERGYALTNYHVVDGVANIQVTLHDDHTTTARVVGHDTKTDLAVVKFDPPEDLQVIRVGTSHDLMVGESVIAVGNAYGYQHTATEGIVSALHRSVQVSETQKYLDLIQTSASINPGNSGGPLMNIDGDVIAINVAVRVGAQGIGFAIPIDEAMEVAAKLMSSERISRTSHGVTGKTLNDGDTPRFVVTSVKKDSPADLAGIKPNDVVTSVDSRPIERALDFERFLVGRRAGDEIEVLTRRGDRSISQTLTLADAQEKSPSINTKAWDVIGLRLETISPSAFRQISGKYRGGLKVMSVRPNGPAAKQGISVGDVLVGIHKWETVSLENVSYIINSGEIPDDQVKFYIIRGGEVLFAMVRMNSSPRR